MNEDSRTIRELNELVDRVAAQPTDVALRRRLALKQAQAIRDHRVRRGETPVAVNGSRELGARAGYFQTDLRDGTPGYYMRRADDCLQIAIATCAQIPPQKVPDLRLDVHVLAGRDPEEITLRAWETLTKWADRLGLSIVIHPKPPVTHRRWIGVVAQPGLFNDHCLVMHRRDRLHDPVSLWAGYTTSDYDSDDIEFGITIERGSP